MVVLKRLTSQLATGLLVAGALARPSPQTSSEEPTPTPVVPETEEDIASGFVAELIQNATQIEEELQGGLEKRGLLIDALCDQSSNLVVNLGYAKYQGVANAATGINSWKGSVLLLSLLSSIGLFLWPRSRERRVLSQSRVY